MKKLTVCLLISLGLLVTGCDVENNISTNKNDKESLNLSSPEGRQAHCLQGIKDKIKSDSFSVSWDGESEDNGLIISDGLLEIDGGYYDVECSHEVDGKGFNVNILPIEEITYGEYSNY